MRELLDPVKRELDWLRFGRIALIQPFRLIAKWGSAVRLAFVERNRLVKSLFCFGFKVFSKVFYKFFQTTSNWITLGLFNFYKRISGKCVFDIHKQSLAYRYWSRMAGFSLFLNSYLLNIGDRFNLSLVTKSYFNKNVVTLEYVLSSADIVFCYFDLICKDLN